MNKTILMGRLTRDPEIRTAAGESGTVIARFTLAVNRRFRRDGEASADFINCVAFGKTAEFIEKYINKGRQICVSGRIQTGSYTNRDGQKIYTTEVDVLMTLLILLLTLPVQCLHLRLLQHLLTLVWMVLQLMRIFLSTK